jgi:hypothetical protein
MRCGSDWKNICAYTVEPVGYSITLAGASDADNSIDNPDKKNKPIDGCVFFDGSVFI